MKSLITVFIFLLAANFISAQLYQDFKFVHPKPQANNLRKVQMIDLNNWVSTGANGTFMRTTNAGTNWIFHHKAGRYSNAAQTIGQNYSLWFFDNNRGFVVGDRGFIGITSDGGITFDSVGIGIIPVTQRCNSIWFANQDTGFVAAGSSSGSSGTIARTTDGGLTWTNSLTSTFSLLAITGTSSNTVYVVSADGSVFKTTNAGQNWIPSATTVAQFMYSIDFLDENTGFIVGSGGGMNRTTDAGSNWLPLISPQTNWAFYQIKIVSATEIYAVGDPSFLWKSSDLGNTWTPIPISVSGPANTYVWYSIDKIGSRIVLSGDYGVVAKSDDNGSNWTSEHFSLNTQLIYDLEKVPGTSKLLAVGRQFSSGTRQLYKSVNGGLDWTTQDLFIDFDASAISMVNSQVGYISGTNAQVLKTTDGGATWNPVTQPFTGTNNIYSMEFINPDTGWVFVNFTTISGGNIFKTTNGGLSWTQQTNGLSNSIYSADMVDANVGYHTINSSSKPIFKTTDGGNTWNSVATPLTGIIKSVKALDANNLYIAASSGTTRLARSTDGGATWIPISLPFAVDITSIDFVDNDTGYVCGNTTTVVGRTTDKGLTWSFENLHLPALTKVVVLPGDTAFAFGTYASILKFDPDDLIPVELSSFTASVTEKSINLMWTTASELNNRGFEIERKASISDQWVTVGFVEGSGTTTETKTYVFQDFDVTAGSYNYRIRQIDYDGTANVYNLPETIVFGAPTKFELAQNYPNPFNPSTTISFSIPQRSDVSVKIYDVLGNEVATIVNETKDAGKYNINFNASKLSSGVYFYSIKAGEFSLIKKMILIK